MVILLLSNKWDLSLDYVVQILKRRDIPYIRINTEDLIEKKSSVFLPDFSFSVDNKLKIDNFASDVKSILLRRPGKPYEFINPKRRPSKAIVDYVSDQWHSFLSGLQSIPDILWINNPLKNAYAEAKINQLYMAEKIKFRIPKTRITNDIQILKSFWNECNGNIVAKSLSSPLINEDNQEFFIFTNKLKSIRDIKEKEILIAPTIFQEALIQKKDYRITVIGNDCHVVEVKMQNNSQEIDWRKIKKGIKFVRSELPDDIRTKCIKLVSELGLIFGAIDLIKINDDYYFLEINPNGEWGWLQKTTKLPIAESLVNNLIRGN